MSSFPPPPGDPNAAGATSPWGVPASPAPPPGGFGAPPSSADPPGLPGPATYDAPATAIGYGPPPGGPSGPPPGGPFVGPPAGGGKKKAGIIAAVIVVAAAAGGGTYFLTRSDDKPKVDGTDITIDTTDSTESTDTAGPDTTEATETTLVDTTAATTTTVEETTTTATTIAETTTTSTFVVPAGAIDLGHQLYLPLPAGWTQNTSDPGSKVVSITDGKTTLAVQVLERTAGEAPTQVVQEYANTFGTVFEGVSYGQTRYIKRINDPAGIPVDEYSTYYITYDGNDPDGVGLNGVINNYIRGDGLNLVYDLYGPDGGTGYPDDSSAELLTSMSKAPAIIAAPLTLTPSPDFKVATNYPNIDVDGLVGFTPAPGFHAVFAGNGRGFASNDIEDFDVVKLTGQASAEATLETAKGLLGGTYQNITYGDPNVVPPNADGVIQIGIGWTGTYIAGNPSAGAIDIFFDPTTSNAYSITSSWFTGADNTEPAASQAAFMFRSIYNSFNHIP